MVEHLPSEQSVAGSIPVVRSKAIVRNNVRVYITREKLIERNLGNDPGCEKTPI